METIKCKVCGKEIPENEYGTCEECHEKIVERLDSKEDSKEEIKKKEKKEKKEEVKKDLEKPIITARVLFITVLDIILMVLMIILFISLCVVPAFSTLRYATSKYFDFWETIGLFIVRVIAIGVIGLVLDLLYLCASKTMLCLTKTQVYKEIYYPFIEFKSSIPLEKITKVSTYEFLWIFRCIIIFQYNHLPLVFFTWKNKEFKDKLVEELKLGKKEIENEFENKHIIKKEWLKGIGCTLVVLLAIILVSGLINVVSKAFSEERKLIGKFVSGTKYVQIEDDGTCDIFEITGDKGYGHKWRYDEDSNLLTIEYVTLESYKYIYGTYEEDHTITFEFDEKENVLRKDDIVYKKEK